MTARPKLSHARMMLDAFLAWPGDGSKRKFQLVDGEHRAMAPAEPGAIAVIFGCPASALDVKRAYMDWSKHHDGGRRYHHGNLREALIEAALRLIAEKGPGGFTIAEAARVAGVSPAAPYRHFRDGQDLLADVALRGFERFAAALRVAWDEGRPEPVAAFERLGRAYLAFARNEPAYYAAMFEAGLPHAAYPVLSRAGEEAFAVLREAAETLCARLPKGERPPPLMVALHVWSLSHGIASLFGRGDASRRALPMSPEELLEAGVLVYLQGLGLADRGTARNSE